MNAALIGSVSSSAATLRGMLRGGLPVAGVCGLHERHEARVSDFHGLGRMAAGAGVPFLAFDKVTEPAVAEFLKAHSPDWLFVVGISQLVPADIRQLARVGAVGFHPTPLPEGRGRAPVAWTILLQRPAAANLFFLADEADAGDIIAQRPVPVLPDDYARDLIDRTNIVLEQMVADLAPAFASGNVPRAPQDASGATYYPRRRPEDGRIDWNRPANEIHRLVRAVSHPYPGAFTFRGGQKVIVWRAKLEEGAAPGGAPGTVVGLEGSRPVVLAASGRLVLTDIEIQGGDSCLKAGKTPTPLGTSGSESERGAVGWTPGTRLT
jgi:methionyl-tRNA formyltransferase